MFFALARYKGVAPLGLEIVWLKMEFRRYLISTGGDLLFIASRSVDLIFYTGPRTASWAMGYRPFGA